MEGAIWFGWIILSIAGVGQINCKFINKQTYFDYFSTFTRILFILLGLGVQAKKITVWYFP